MTIKECIDIVDNLKPNQYTVYDKVRWLSFIDAIIINDVLKTHEGYDGRYDLFEGYSEDKLSVALIVPTPYDRLYTAYLQMKIDSENGETARYNNSVALYNAYMTEYRKYYNKTHMPLDMTNRQSAAPLKKATMGLSEAEYENLKRDLYYKLVEYFSPTVSPDKLYDIVTSYAQNNVDMFMGKDGGYYVPSFKQIDENTVQMTFEPSKGNMPSVPKATLELPSGSDGSGVNIITINYGDKINAEELYNAYNNGAVILLRGSHNFDYIDGGMITTVMAEYVLHLTSVSNDNSIGQPYFTFTGSDNYGNGINVDYWLDWSLQIVNNLTYAQDYADSIETGGLDSLLINGASISLHMESHTEYECVNGVTSLTIQDFVVGTGVKADNWCIKFSTGSSITVTIPDTVVWANGEPTFTAGKSYYLSFIPMFDKHLGVFAEV